MAEPTIKRGSDQFFITRYEGNGFGQKVGNFVPFTDSGTIAKSCMFEDGDTPTLSRTIGTATSTTTFTISFWIKRCNTGLLRGIWSREGANDNNELRIYFDSSDRLNWSYYPGGDTAKLTTNRTFEDKTKWYHIVAVSDTTNATEASRWRLYVDGSEVSDYATATYPSQSTSIALFSSGSYSEYIGRARSVSTTSIDGYLAEFNIVDGSALTPSTFGLTDTSTGRWIPKTLTGITYGDTGRRLTFANTAGLTIGDDTSGNGDDFTVSNLVGTDITTDSPTQNHMTLGGRTGSNITLSQGNLKCTVGPSDTQALSSFGLPPSGKWYWEITLTTLSSYGRIGVTPEEASTGQHPLTAGMGYDRPETANGVRIKNVDIGSGWDGAFTEGNIVNFALDADNKFMYIGENNTWRNSGDPTSGAAGTGGIPYGNQDFANKILHPAMGSGNAGGTKVYDFNFGQKGFAYTPPTDYNAPQQDNFTDEGVKPDFVWIKNIDASDDHQLYDSSRGPQKMIESNQTTVEETDSDGLQKFLQNGFTIEDDVRINTNGESYISWNWVANGGTTSANTSATPTIASTFQANPTAGFSIVTYTGTGSAGSIQHGLSSAPEWILLKKRTNDTQAWQVYHAKNTSAPETEKLTFNTNAATVDDHTTWNDQSPTSSVFYVGTGSGTNESTDTYVAYCWHSIDGFSKFGGYTGNGSSNGVYVHLGFRPSFIIIKRTNSTNDWVMYNSKLGINPIGSSSSTLYPNSSSAKASAGGIDFLSNGFKARSTNGNNNGNGNPYVYMAFAEHPFIGSGSKSPLTARLG